MASARPCGRRVGPTAKFSKFLLESRNHHNPTTKIHNTRRAQLCQWSDSNKTWTTKNNTWVKASSRLFLIHLFHSVRLNYSRLYPLFVVPCFIRTTSFFNPLLKINQSIPSLYCFVRVLRLLLLLLLLYDSAIQLRVFTFRVELIFYKDKLFVFVISK